MTIKITAYSSSSEFNYVNSIIQQNWSPEVKHAWETSGFDGMARYVPEEFGMQAMYRDKNNYVTFEFTDEQYFLFNLRYA